MPPAASSFETPQFNPEEHVVIPFPNVNALGQGAVAASAELAQVYYPDFGRNTQNLSEETEVPQAEESTEEAAEASVESIEEHIEAEDDGDESNDASKGGSPRIRLICTECKVLVPVRELNVVIETFCCKDCKHNSGARDEEDEALSEAYAA